MTSFSIKGPSASQDVICTTLLLCCRGAARAPTVDVRANRLAGTAFGAIGLPGASQPPLAIRKLQRAKVEILNSTTKH